MSEYPDESNITDAHSPELSDVKFSGFVKGVVIADLIFCCFRPLAIISAVLGLVLMLKNDVFNIFSIVPIVLHLGVAFFGILGNILLLLKKRVAMILCWGNVFFTFLSVGLVAWQIALAFVNPPNDEPAFRIGMVLGAVVVGVLKFGWFIVYIIALIRAGKYFKNLAPNCRLQEG